MNLSPQSSRANRNNYQPELSDGSGGAHGYDYMYGYGAHDLDYDPELYGHAQPLDDSDNENSNSGISYESDLDSYGERVPKVKHGSQNGNNSQQYQNLSGSSSAPKRKMIGPKKRQKSSVTQNTNLTRNLSVNNAPLKSNSGSVGPRRTSSKSEKSGTSSKSKKSKNSETISPSVDSRHSDLLVLSKRSRDSSLTPFFNFGKVSLKKRKVSLKNLKSDLKKLERFKLKKSKFGRERSLTVEEEQHEKKQNESHLRELQERGEQIAQREQQRERLPNIARFVQRTRLPSPHRIQRERNTFLNRHRNNLLQQVNRANLVVIAQQHVQPQPHRPPDRR